MRFVFVSSAFLALISLQILGTTNAWTQQPRVSPPITAEAHAIKQRSWDQKARDDNHAELPASSQRRSFLASAFMASAASMTSPRLAAAEEDKDPNANDKDSSKYNDDVLEAFGQDIGAAKWPNTSSPLPKPKPPSSESTAPVSDLQKALEQAQKKKNVGPLTHG